MKKLIAFGNNKIYLYAPQERIGSRDRILM
jgi:hypothetical protein